VPPAQAVLSFAPPAHQKPAGHTAPSSDKVAGGQYFDSLPHSLPLPGLVFDVVLLSAPGPVFDIVLLSLSEVQKANRILGHERPGWCYPTGRCAYLPSVTCYRQSIKPSPPPPPPPPVGHGAFGPDSVNFRQQLLQKEVAFRALEDVTWIIYDQYSSRIHTVCVCRYVLVRSKINLYRNDLVSCERQQGTPRTRRRLRPMTQTHCL
jgi:hypothetical protein